jgi:2-polyprenyl-3-methyl-5-hydroxy-6-metoxy-1,4-benzoquinol methylase
MPTSAEIEEFYTNYYRRGDRVGYDNYSCEPTIGKLDFALLDAVKRFGPSGKLSSLDVGCAYGSRVLFFRNHGIDASGVDISKDATEHGRARWGLNLFWSGFEGYRPGKTFDVVTMIDFIEHLQFPTKWIETLLAVTSPGSIVLVVTPDYDCYHLYGEMWAGYNSSLEHVTFYNRKSLARLLNQAGFTIDWTAGVRTMAAKLDANSGTDAPSLHLPTCLHSIRQIGFVDQTLRSIRPIVQKLTWRDIVFEDRVENSLLVVARRN